MDEWTMDEASQAVAAAEAALQLQLELGPAAAAGMKRVTRDEFVRVTQATKYMCI